MGFNFSGTTTTSAHQHSTLASDGGQLSLVETNISGFNPISLVIALS